MKVLKKILTIFLIVFIVGNIVLQGFISLKGYGITLLDVYTQSLPVLDKINIKYKDKYLIENKTVFAKQGLNQCAGYSSAYLMRMMGFKKVEGKQVYSEMSHKFSNGYVMPQAIVNYFKDKGFAAKIYTGSIEQLKMRLNEGKPIIVLINDQNVGLHYVNVIGYSETKIFIADSIMDKTSGKYNKVYSLDEFEKSWRNTGLPFFKNTYYLIG